MEHDVTVRLALFIAMACLLIGLAMGARAQIIPQIIYARTHAAACGTLSLVLSNSCNAISVPVVF